MKKKIDYLLVFSWIAVPILIYFYFINWRTNIIYGDDLNIYSYQGHLSTFWEKMNIDVPSRKYRPIHGITIQLLISFFQKNLVLYYCFNVAIQAINTFVLARLLNLFLRSPWWSIFFSLLAGLSRFSFFNVTQLLNGGNLEGLALTFFLLFLFYTVRALIDDQSMASQKQKWLIMAIVYGNLSLYTHERYIVVFLFFLLVVWVFPGLRVLTKKQRIGLSMLALFSIILNVVIKELIFSIPFFMGTGGQAISFSFSSALSLFMDAVLSIFQVNSGQYYLVGMLFSDLPDLIKVIVLLLVAGLLLVLVLYMIKSRKVYAAGQKAPLTNFLLFLYLSVIFGLLLVPAVSTIRVEQRWLQGPFNILILMLVVALSGLSFKNNGLKKLTMGLFIFCFWLPDYTYLYKGAQNLYMVHAEMDASAFAQACRNGVIRPGTEKIYYWEKERIRNNEGGMNWVLDAGGGWAFFNFYGYKVKKMSYADSIYANSYPFTFCTFGLFDKTCQQIIYHDQGGIADITNYYLKDSLKDFTARRMNDPGCIDKMKYDKDRLFITNDDFGKLTVKGFSADEDGIRWTNGAASLGFPGYYTIKDTLDLELNTYMPSVCKNINPRITLTGENKEEYQPVSSKRTGDKFSFTFDFPKFTPIQQINILSDTLSGLPAGKTLSFPFVSLELKKRNY